MGDLTQGGKVAWIPQPRDTAELVAMVTCPWCGAEDHICPDSENLRLFACRPKTPPQGSKATTEEVAKLTFSAASPLYRKAMLPDDYPEGQCARVAGDLLAVCYDRIVETYGDRGEDSIRAALASGLLDGLLERVRGAASGD